MKKYYIYHIPGIKIGCSSEPHRRIKVQSYDNYEILEEHSDVYLASKREMELQQQYGYPIDKVPYFKTIKMPTKKSCIKGGKNTGKIHSINNSGVCNFNSRSKGGKSASLKVSIPIIQMDIFGNHISEFTSANQAAICLGLERTTITKVCKGKQKTHGGYRFKYKND